MQIGPPRHGGDFAAQDLNLFFIEGTMHHSGIKPPERHILHGMFPTAQ